MTEQTALSLTAACFGFIAAIYFCVGSALTSHRKLVALSKTYWGYNLEFAKATVTQSTQYAVGGLLLLVSFVLQVVALVASPTNIYSNHPFFGHFLFVVGANIFMAGLFSLVAFKIANKFRIRKVEEQLKRDSSK